MPTSADTQILANIVKSIQGEEEDPLTPLIDDYIVKRNLPKYRDKRVQKIELDVSEVARPPGRLSPSSICGCAREAAFKFLGAKGQRRVSPQMELIFEDGHWRHHKWQHIFNDMERVLGRKRFRLISIEENIRIDKFHIAGALDAIVEIKVHGKWRRYVIDIKGANKYAYESTYRDRAPNPTYVKQLTTYGKAKKCKYGILLFDCKDNNDFHCYVFKFDDDLWGEIKLWCRDVISHLNRKKLPPMHPECKNGNFLHNRCPYRALCYGKRTDRQVEQEVFVDFQGVKKQWEKSFAKE